MSQQLRRQLGLFQLLCVSVSSIIGSAWLFAAMFASQLAGPAAIISWLISAGAAMLLALVYAELGAAFPVAGGLARFSYFSHGNLTGFLAGMACWLGYVAVAPIEVQAMVRYLSDFLPWLLQDEHTRTLSACGTAVSAGLLLLMSMINLLGVSWLGESNKLLTIWKLLIPVLIPITLLTVAFRPGNFTDFGGFLPGGWNGVFAAVSTGGTLFAMLGFRTAIEMAGEAKNPQRDIPLALIGSVFITSAVYILIQIAFIGALPGSSLAHGWSKLSSHVDTGPFVELAAAAGLFWLVKLILVDSVVSPGGCGMVFCGASARLSFAMARNGQLPQWFTILNRNGVPSRAILVNFLVGLIFFAPSQTWQSIVSFISSIQVMSLAFGPPALIALRRTAPHVARPFRLPAYRALCSLAFIAANIMIYWCGWQTNRVCFFILLVMGLLFVVLKKIRTPRESLDLSGLLWLAPYGLGIAVISLLGQFGGGWKWVPSGWDAALLAAGSLCILRIAEHAPTARLPEEISPQTS